VSGFSEAGREKEEENQDFTSRVESKLILTTNLLPLVKPDMQISRIRLSYCLRIIAISGANYNRINPRLLCK